MKIATIGLQPGKLATALMEQGVEFIEADITNQSLLRNQIEYHNPDAIIHTAAATGVDWCEDNPVEALKINARGVDNIISWWKGRLIYISTDYVFDGKKWFSSGYSEKHSVNPISAYGTSKLAGEMIALNGWSNTTVVRTTVLYGGKGPSFVTWVLDQFDKGEPFALSTKMITTPTNIYHLSEALLYIANQKQVPNVINVVGSDIVSRYTFGTMIAKTFDKDLELLQMCNETTFGKAKRPTRAGLQTTLAKSLGVPIYSLREGLELMRSTYG